MESVFRFYIRTILRATSMMITNTEMTNWIIEKFSGSGGIRTHDLRVTSPLLYQLRYRALGAVREWIPIYMAHVIPVTSCKLTISPGWSQWLHPGCFIDLQVLLFLSLVMGVSSLRGSNFGMQLPPNIGFSAKTFLLFPILIVFNYNETTDLTHLPRDSRLKRSQSVTWNSMKASTFYRRNSWI